MSLVVEVRINNGPPVAIVTAQRLEGSEDPDSLNQYKVEIYQREGRRVRRTDTLELQHRYGDGALVLAARALQASL